MFTIFGVFCFSALLIWSTFKTSPDSSSYVQIEQEELELDDEYEAIIQEENEEEENQGRCILLKKFWEAIQIEGVLHYGLAFFCIKFAVYSLMLWLPLFFG